MINALMNAQFLSASYLAHLSFNTSPRLPWKSQDRRTVARPGGQGHEEDHQRPQPRIARTDGVDHLKPCAMRSHAKPQLEKITTLWLCQYIAIEAMAI
jgi:hypothetical protein